MINPSAIKVAQPIKAKIITQEVFLFFNKAKSAKIPPSPLLSALSAKKTYFTVANKIKVQITQDKPPKIKSGAILVPPPVIAWKTYKGDVPISPKTIPDAINIPASEILCEESDI